MKKKAIIILSLVLIISIVSNIVIVLSANAEDNKFESAVSNINTVTKDPTENVLETRDISTESGIKTVTYKRTFYNSIDDYVHEYYDELGNQYNINDSGKVVEFYSSYNNKKVTEDSLESGELIAKSEDEIIGIALSKIKTELPDDYSDYKMTDCDFEEYNNSYSIRFGKRYGENGFITGEEFCLRIHLSGKIFSWSEVNIEQLKGFDLSRLDGIARNDVENYGCKQVAAKYQMDIDKLEAVEFQLVKISEYYAIRVYIANKDMPNGGTMDMVYYEV